MGIVNVTPDSFSDGGQFDSPESACAHARLLVKQGAAIIDVGGESTRPGSNEISEAVELARVLPVVSRLASEGLIVSIDTRHASVARACIEAGAAIINDVSGFRNQDMVDVAASCEAGLIVVHMQGEPKSMQDNPSYSNVVEEVACYLIEQAHKLRLAGVKRNRICIDPGPGFGKSYEHNLELLKSTPMLAKLGYPLVAAWSRKSFIGQLTGIEQASERVLGSVAITVHASSLGAHILRVHDVSATVRALMTYEVLKRLEAPEKHKDNTDVFHGINCQTTIASLRRMREVLVESGQYDFSLSLRALKDVQDFRGADGTVYFRGADDPAGFRRADGLTEIRRADGLTETRRADEPAKLRRAGKTAKPRRANAATNSREPGELTNARRAGELTNARGADELTIARGADELTTLTPDKPRRVFIGLGSNLGDSVVTLKAAIVKIAALPKVTLLHTSSFYESEPAYYTDQHVFINAVIEVLTTLSPFELLWALQAIETEFGRARTVVNGPRSLDLDIIDYEGVVSNDPELLLPHPLALERDFVVTPLEEIAPNHVFAEGSVLTRVGIEQGNITWKCGGYTGPGFFVSHKVKQIPQSEQQDSSLSLRMTDEGRGGSATAGNSSMTNEGRGGSATAGNSSRTNIGWGGSATAGNSSRTEESWGGGTAPGNSSLTEGIQRSSTGKLSICATPIGNLGDITKRVIDTLAAADMVLAEDTRVARRLFSHLNIRPKVGRCDENTIRQHISSIIESIRQGSKVALISDSGMPGISDPGAVLIEAVQKAGCHVEVLPGASALLTAVVASGLSTRSFYFGGFLPRKKTQITEALTKLAGLDATLVFFESPHRIADSIAVIAELFPEREAVIARELTKRYEEVLRAPAAELAELVARRERSGNPLKGEIVLLIGPPPKTEEKRTHKDRYADKAPQKLAIPRK